MGSDIAEHTDAHCHGNGHSFLFRRGLSTDIALCTVCLLCVGQGRYMRTYRAEGHFRVCIQGCSVAECTKQGRAAVIVSVVLCAIQTMFVTTPPISSPSLPHCLICQSLTTLASFPLSPLFFSLSQIPLLFSYFFSFLSSCSVAISFWLSISLLSFPLLPSFFPAPLLQSVSLFFAPACSLLSLYFPLPLTSAASMFLCVDSWDAFVEGFHSDLNKSSFTSVRCKLDRGHVISPRHTGRPVPLNHHNCYPATSEMLHIF